MSDPVRAALANVQAVLARYVEPGGPGDAETIIALLRILDAETLIRAQDAAGPQPIATLKPEPERSYLLFCPEQGGWHVGHWWAITPPRWVVALGVDNTLEPTHWMPIPADPV